MANVIKTVVSTGATSGLGFEAIKQLLAQSQSYHFILGTRDLQRAEKDFGDLSYDRQKHSLTFLPLQLSDLRTVKTFATQTLEKLGSSKIDLLLLNAAINKPADEPGVNGSKWCETYVVNSLSQHYLTHLLRERVTGRVVVTSSGAMQGVSGPARVELLDKELTANSGADSIRTYENTKFTQLLTTHWWRRELQGQAQVVAVSPGFIPGTALTRDAIEKLGKGIFPEAIMKSAKSVPEGAQSILAAYTRQDLPEDQRQIFLTSWGEWWATEVLEVSLDTALQDKWSASLAQIEREEVVE
ncbi:NAD(P)-binding protein [Karstenula rhodostoma CBS 690.94]|uniref:NAD(P)-binding protein n=1 Tax=Karstenula rhodostoma CBS 690.94 TaxID=1392251 RepID=A0A9P4PRJ4_9PLEO|nr:NAD(P)-binding protein [Karstenula rhodostoma CBS 690.94]